jgi:hypothetical protein
MAGSRWPFPWSTGVRPLRADLHARIDVVAQEATGLGIVDAQWAGLRAGQPVTLTTSQLVSFYPGGDEHPSLPPDLNAAEGWTLRGDETLSPAS